MGPTSFLAGPVVVFGGGPFGLFPPENKVLAKFFFALSSGVIIGFLGFYFISGAAIVGDSSSKGNFF